MSCKGEASFFLPVYLSILTLPFSPLRMTKRGDARRSVDRRFSSYRQPSPRGEGAPQGRIGHWRRYEREREGASQVDDLRKHPSAADAVPLPRWGRQISSGYAAILRLRSQLFWHSLSHIRRFSPLRMTKCAAPPPTLPIEPIEPAKTLSQMIKGQHAGGEPSPRIRC